MKKTTVDKSIFITGILYSMVFILPILINKNLWNSKIGLFFLLLGCIVILISTWKYDNTQIKKYNFLGLFLRKYLLKDLTSYKNKFIKIGFNKNPLAIIYFKKKNSRQYIEPNIIYAYFDNGNTLKIDERTISKQDFLNLKRIIKQYKIK